MSDIGADLEAADELVRGAENELLKREPNHELIAYLHIKEKEEREAAWQKQLRKFSRYPKAEGNVQGANECTYAMIQYFLALEVALGNRPPPLAEECKICKCGVQFKLVPVRTVGLDYDQQCPECEAKRFSGY